ncbi:MAG: Ppx/GppA family phosphatase [Propionibacterium sp.]|nr:Ppx/GppA family phosphatase [Actinomyces sp.]MDN6794633.1 Ppx/GppA family phosphatase [Propionibacterium sp.]
MTRVAAIDCGTNSIRLLVADVEWQEGPGDTRTPHLRDLTRQMRIVRLGQGVDRTGVLDPGAIERTLEATREYAEMIDRLGVDSIRFVSTSATRDASNRAEFVEGVRRILGVEPEVVPGTEEAALSFRGAISAVDAQAPRPLLVVDIGGGSTELVLGSDTVEQAVSIDMGSVRVTEKFLTNGVDRHSEAAAVSWIDAQLDAAADRVDLARVGTLVGVAGTVTTVTAQALGLTSYQPERIHGAVLDLAQVDAAVRFMVEEPIPVKAALGFMPQGREDVIAAGALIWSRVIARVVERAATRGHVIDHVLTSEHDILDGIALSQV